VPKQSAEKSGFSREVRFSIAEMTLPTSEIEQVKFCHGALIGLVFLPVW
jgi:hypothetical protein